MDRSFRLAYFCPRVREEIESWPVDLLARCDELLDLLEDHGPLLGSPHSKSLGEGLFELRPKSRSGIGRAFFCYCSGRMIIVLHAFIKKTQKTPQRDLTIARNRIKEIRNHG
jgi:phage-related protein